MEIYKTTNYSIFSFLQGNRSVSKKNSLVKSIQKIDLTMYKPILVDSEFRIIDGQHRFFACMELNKPIYYMIVENENINDALIVLNSNQKMWRQEEYLGFFAETKKGSYMELKEFMDRTGMTISNAMVVYPDSQINSNHIKSGNLNIDKNYSADNIADFLNSEEVKRLKFRNTRPFVLSIRKAFEIYTKKQLNKLRKNSIMIPMCANYSQYLTVFENIIK